MNAIRYGLAAGVLLGMLAGCAGLKGKTEADAQAGAAQDLAAACGVYELAKPLAVAAIPDPYKVPVAIVLAYVDPVCTNQAPFAMKLGTAAWVVKNAQVIKDLQAKAAALAPKP